MHRDGPRSSRRAACPCRQWGQMMWPWLTMARGRAQPSDAANCEPAPVPRPRSTLCLCWLTVADPYRSAQPGHRACSRRVQSSSRQTTCPTMATIRHIVVVLFPAARRLARRRSPPVVRPSTSALSTSRLRLRPVVDDVDCIAYCFPFEQAPNNRWSEPRSARSLSYPLSATRLAGFRFGLPLFCFDA